MLCLFKYSILCCITIVLIPENGLGRMIYELFRIKQLSLCRGAVCSLQWSGLFSAVVRSVLCREQKCLLQRGTSRKRRYSIHKNSNGAD